MAAVNFALGSKFTLFGAELYASYSKEGDNTTLLVNMSETAENSGITIQKLIEDINSLAGGTQTGITADSITSAISTAANKSSAFDVKSVLVRLQTIYLKSTKDKTEYALRFDVILKGLLPAKISLINPTSLSISVWNTTEESVLKQLSLPTT